MCQQLYSHLKLDESATNRLLIAPIERNSGVRSAQIVFNNITTADKI